MNVFSVILCLAILFFVGCDVPYPVCGDGACSESESCSTCVSDCGECQSCGNGACDPSEDCSVCQSDCGECPATCSAVTCAGCCVGSVCLDGSSPSSCGSSGSFCAVCPTGYACSSGACSLDPSSLWSIELVSLTVSTTTVFGDPWDVFGGAPDPYVVIQTGSDSGPSHMSEATMDAFSVQFMGSGTVTGVRADAVESYIRFDVYDSDASGDEFVGACILRMNRSAFSGAEQRVDCAIDAATGNSGFTILWRLF